MNVVIVPPRRHDQLKLRVISDIQDQFSGNVAIVDNCDRHELLVTEGNTTEVDCFLLDEDFRTDDASFHWQSKLLAPSDVHDDFRGEVDLDGSLETNGEGLPLVGWDFTLHGINSELLVITLNVEDG